MQGELLPAWAVRHAGDPAIKGELGCAAAVGALVCNGALRRPAMGRRRLAWAAVGGESGQGRCRCWFAAALPLLVAACCCRGCCDLLEEALLRSSWGL